MNNLFFSRKSANQNFQDISKKVQHQQSYQTSNTFNGDFSNRLVQQDFANQNSAQNYYPELLNVPESSPKEDSPFDINDLSQFQQDFSYLQNSISQQAQENEGSFIKNNKKTGKNEKNIENNDKNSYFFNEFGKNFDFERQNPNFSSKNGQFFASNFDKNEEQQKKCQKNGINFENMLHFLKNGSQTDLLSSMLASGALKNNNPAMVEAISKMLSKKNETSAKKSTHSIDNNFFEDM